MVEFVVATKAITSKAVECADSLSYSPFLPLPRPSIPSAGSGWSSTYRATLTFVFGSRSACFA